MTQYMQIPYHQKTDAELARDVKTYDHAAYAELIRRYQNTLYPYLIRLLGNHEDALDIVQETFLKVYEQIQGFDERKQFSSWLYRIAHNIGINYLKKHARTIKIDADALALVAERHAARAHELTTANIRRAEELLLAINRLKPKYKDVVLLYFYEEKSYAEIGEILRLPTSTVGVQLDRAKKQLHALLTAT